MHTSSLSDTTSRPPSWEASNPWHEILSSLALPHTPPAKRPLPSARHVGFKVDVEAQGGGCGGRGGAVHRLRTCKVAVTTELGFGAVGVNEACRDQLLVDLVDYMPELLCKRVHVQPGVELEIAGQPPGVQNNRRPV
eukprot:CAMPEP_0197863762 /NCGR_PEP_ID=MMETSP1438-20131217/41459_1 /TAXON_ID=1461541 /ORGANISM="Pterosperma sp., Strain CCMP1384" /LENGTH=136 /DNA_ID=CAMNT_0043481777 /DNA_START=521 /DNA_END=929 /DNA_ORIENTATION=+